MRTEVSKVQGLPSWQSALIGSIEMSLFCQECELMTASKFEVRAFAKLVNILCHKYYHTSPDLLEKLYTTVAL